MSLPHTTYVEMIHTLEREIDSLCEWSYGDFQGEVCELLENTRSMVQHLMKVIPTPSFPSDTAVYRLPHDVFMNKYEMLSKELQMIADVSLDPTCCAVDRLMYDAMVARASSYAPTTDYETFCNWRNAEPDTDSVGTITSVKLFLHSLSASAIDTTS